MKTGKKIRFQRFLYPQRRFGLIVPIDHGLTMGPLPGIRTVSEIGKWITHSAVTGIICHKGMAERLAENSLLDGKGLMIHLNGMSTLASRPDTKRPLTNIDAALRLGADAVSLQLNFDGTNDAENLVMLGLTVDEASKYELPVLAMVYDKVKTETEYQSGRIIHLVRIAMELGCDAVKIAAPMELKKTLSEISSDIHVFVAGGDIVHENELVSLCIEVVEQGGSGLCIGRNIFQRENVEEILTLLKTALFESRGAYGVN